MKFKLDENLGQRGAAILRGLGHDVAVVTDQGLASATDRKLIAVCASENRCLVTLDLDFANPLQFPPVDYSGIAVLRPGSPTSMAHIEHLVENLARAVGSSDIRGRLWIVELDRIREYTQRDELE
jgi:predicted nuclease of predicted toxin-antitoxin system